MEKANELPAPPADAVAGPNTHIVAAAVAPATTAEIVEAPAQPAAEVAEQSSPEQAEPAAESSSAAEASETSAKSKVPTSILVVDIGGTKVKFLATGHTHPRKASSGKAFTPARLVETVRELAEGWEYEAISIGYPGLVGSHGPRSEPGNLGPGWVGFDFAAAFGKPVKMMNDAAMQALGSYEGGRMLFLGFGTGLGSTLIAGNVIVPLELGQLLYDRKLTLGQVLGRRGQQRIGGRAWRKAVTKVVTALMRAFVADYIVIGGGNAKNIRELPPGARLGHNLTAFRGGFRLWSVKDVWVLADPGGESSRPTMQESLRML